MTLRPVQRRLDQGPVPQQVKDELKAYLSTYADHVPAYGGTISVQQVADRLQQALQARQALSVIRLAEGEGACLFGAETDRYPALARHVAKASLTRHFGRQDWTDADLQWAHQDLAGAVAASGIVTFARREAVFRALITGPLNDIRAVVGATWTDLWHTRQGTAHTAAMYRDSFLHRDLLPYLPQILRGQQVVLVGSLGDAFAQRLAERMGVAGITTVHITGQWSNGDDGPPLYPDGLEKVRSQLAALAGPGVLVLVAAGLAAKGLCAFAAGHGAVAFDVGSIMDVWAGRAVRPYHADEFVERHQI